MMLLRASSGNVYVFAIMMGSRLWGPHAKHGGRGAWGGVPSE